MNIVKAAAVQMSPVLYSREGTVEKVCRSDHRARSDRAYSSRPFPETVVPYYPVFLVCAATLRDGVLSIIRLLDQAVDVPSDATRGDRRGL